MTLELCLELPRLLWAAGSIVTLAMLNDERRARFAAKNAWLETWPKPFATVILIFAWPLTWWELRQ